MAAPLVITTLLGLSPTSVEQLGRRALVSRAAAAGAVAPLLVTHPHLAARAASSPPPVLVLGAGGGTGRACVSALLSRGIPCIASTRSGAFELQDPAIPDRSLLRTVAADVTRPSTLEPLVGGAQPLRGVIFAASASAKGGDAGAVDRDGVISTARACIRAGVPRLCIVSSGAVTRPDSAVYQLLNFVGKGIMEAKIEGEDAVRALYAPAELAARGVGYTIVRPGGLTPAFDDAGAWLGKGVPALELNQGDRVSGRISRADVAALCVESLASAAAFDTTFECYEVDTAKPLESVGLSNILGLRSPTSLKTGAERRSASGGWQEIFTGLRRDEAPSGSSPRGTAGATAAVTATAAAGNLATPLAQW